MDGQGHDRRTSWSVEFQDAYARGKNSDAPFHKLKSGTVLVRECARHSVTIVGDGLEHFFDHGNAQAEKQRRPSTELAGWMAPEQIWAEMGAPLDGIL